MRIIINENQAKQLVESKLAEAKVSALPDFVVEKEETVTNPFINTGYFVRGVLNKLATERQEEVRGYFSDDIDSFSKDKVAGKLSKLVTKCIKLEEPNKDKLEKICSNTVVKIFGIPEDAVTLSCELGPVSSTKSFHIKPDTEEYEYDTIEDIDEYDADTNKRRIINALSYGAAKEIAEQSKSLWINEIFDIDEELPHLYSQIMKINDYIVFNTDIKIEDKDHKQGGNVEISLGHEDEVANISSTGVIFPILLQETVRGVIDMIGTFGLPDDINSAERVTNIADALENEPWNMRFGPAMWNRVISNIDGFETEMFAPFFKKLVELDTDEFSMLMKEVFAGTKQGKSKIAEIYNEAKYDNEYDKFTNDLALRNGKDIIDDDCFTEEELDGNFIH